MSELTEALAILQETQTKLSEALNALSQHNIDEEAHPGLQEIVQNILNSEAVYTKDQINEMVKNGIASHTEASFEEAHPGWETFQTTLESKLNQLSYDITAINNRLDVEDANSGKTDIQKILQKIEDKYAPILENLQSAFQQAVDANNTMLAEQYKETIGKTLEEKKNELTQAMEDYYNGTSSDSDEEVTEEPVIEQPAEEPLG